MLNSKNIVDRSSITKTGVDSAFFSIRQNTTTDSGGYAFHLAISRMLNECVTNQGESPSGSATYKPFNPLYSTKSDHHALTGFGTYKDTLAHDPHLTSYYAYDYNEKHSNLADSFHQAIKGCFGINQDFQHDSNFTANFSYNGKYKFVFTRMVMVRDGAENLYSPYWTIRQNPGGKYKLACPIKEDNHYYGFVLYNEDGASYAYEAIACNKNLNPLTDIESCINTHFEDVADLF
ncbi:hypothetical protein Cyrtocomes_01199 [Candidatus Cyrtobacter comes]|uniref:Uncharacterized protein n=1 Tax=Candidatus Cyrtobacter comes TaxID=675776 RepID=A0ABU5LAC7_9RICK|nr:hypothetical protein [Candidatus Cyrtobacter comes]MDZ5762804.1 hypothetical protein [Candidatus Cyrtobacter comes]